jgi:uncharacterized protein (DUF2252 family)
VVEEVRHFNEGRKPRPLAIKYARMASGPFAFFRGTLDLFAREWNELKPASLGPELLSCGDLHLENLGAYETDDAVFCYDVNDFDEALFAPAAFDLVRLAASVLLAAELWQSRPDHLEQTVGHLLDNYRGAVAGAESDSAPGELTLEQGEGPIRELLGQAAAYTVADMLDRHTKLGKNGRRRILRSDDKHPELSDDRAKKLTEAVEDYGRRHNQESAFQVLDVTGRIAGLGSLGVRRALVLIVGEGSPDGNKLLDIKECFPSAAARWIGRSIAQEPNEAQRVVDAQRHLQARPIAGLDALAIGSRWYRMRVMVPDENRSKLDHVTDDPRRLCAAIAAAGQIAGWCHVRGARYAGTQKELARLAAPGALDDVLPAAQQVQQHVREDYLVFRSAYANGAFGATES